ncbi:NAC domain-containing protein 104-like [Olea europaea var. sylvestris]|uniref:NAC domain-containing protein 104-like n=1 Tax=Olea europaea var. sylvestris TaxID=158386 RepID=UPI000C1D2C97|nr:NAC domain-containing protein 104-like [Olea europaea var. sylvestris]
MMGDRGSIFPPGFYFDPTDEELVLYFLYHKAANMPCNFDIIPDLDRFPPNPWELNDKAFMSERKSYFFSRQMQNRATEKGFWKEIGLDEAIHTSTGNKVGIKKYLVFYTDAVCSDKQTVWMMEEYHLLKNGIFSEISQTAESHIQDLDEWVLCRVHEANMSCHGINFHETDGDGDQLSYLDEAFLSMEDDQEEINFPH